MYPLHGLANTFTSFMWFFVVNLKESMPIISTMDSGSLLEGWRACESGIATESSPGVGIALVHSLCKFVMLL